MYLATKSVTDNIGQLPNTLVNYPTPIVWYGFFFMFLPKCPEDEKYVQTREETWYFALRIIQSSSFPYFSVHLKSNTSAVKKR